MYVCCRFLAKDNENSERKSNTKKLYQKKKWKNDNLKETVSEIENKQKHIE